MLVALVLNLVFEIILMSITKSTLAKTTDIVEN